MMMIGNKKKDVNLPKEKMSRNREWKIRFVERTEPEEQKCVFLGKSLHMIVCIFDAGMRNMSFGLFVRLLQVVR